MTIGSVIERIRLAKGIKQSKLAEMSGVSRFSIRLYEKNERTPGTKQIEKIAKALEIHPADLLGWAELDKARPDLGKEVKEFEIFEHYLSTLGYDLIQEKITLNYFIFTLVKDDISVTFTEKEFNELMNATKDVIETKFYKKVLDMKGR